MSVEVKATVEITGGPFGGRSVDEVFTVPSAEEADKLEELGYAKRTGATNNKTISKD